MIFIQCCYKIYLKDRICQYYFCVQHWKIVNSVLSSLLTVIIYKFVHAIRQSTLFFTSQTSEKWPKTITILFRLKVFCNGMVSWAFIGSIFHLCKFIDLDHFCYVYWASYPSLVDLSSESLYLIS